MTVINLPAGISIDFEDASTEQIEEALTLMQEEQPELFSEPQISEEEYVGSLSSDEAVAYGKARAQLSAEGVPEYKPSNEGEVDDAGFQFFYGRADSIGDKA